MPMIAPSANKSRPIYPEGLDFDPAGRHHVVAALGTAALVALNGALSTLPAAPVTILLADGDATLLPRSNGLIAMTFPGRDTLLKGFSALLAGSYMGIRVYAVGPEAFLWDVDRAAQDFGFGKYEVIKVPAGSIARRVYCCHCKTIDSGVAHDIHSCSGCGVMLQVRDHFSRRHGAFMGVRADAEAPGELPVREMVFP